MQSFFISLANLIARCWEFFSTSLKNFFGLFESLGDMLLFVNDCLALLPLLIKVPCTIILTIMTVKFFLNLGKN